MSMSIVKKKDIFDRVIANVPKALDHSMDAWAERGLGLWKTLMLSSPPTGNTYLSHPFKPTPHTASSPGNPPRVWTGDYLQSLNVAEVGRHERSINTPLQYAEDLELGLKFEPRPVARPVANLLPGRVNQSFKDFESKLI